MQTCIAFQTHTQSNGYTCTNLWIWFSSLCQFVATVVKSMLSQCTCTRNENWIIPPHTFSMRIYEGFQPALVCVCKTFIICTCGVYESTVCLHVQLLAVQFASRSRPGLHFIPCVAGTFLPPVSPLLPLSASICVCVCCGGVVLLSLFRFPSCRSASIPALINSAVYEPQLSIRSSLDCCFDEHAVPQDPCTLPLTPCLPAAHSGAIIPTHPGFTRHPHANFFAVFLTPSLCPVALLMIILWDIATCVLQCMSNYTSTYSTGCVKHCTNTQRTTGGCSALKTHYCTCRLYMI